MREARHNILEALPTHMTFWLLSGVQVSRLSASAFGVWLTILFVQNQPHQLTGKFSGRLNWHVSA